MRYENIEAMHSQSRLNRLAIKRYPGEELCVLISGQRPIIFGISDENRFNEAVKIYIDGDRNSVKFYRMEYLRELDNESYQHAQNGDIFTEDMIKSLEKKFNEEKERKRRELNDTSA